MGERPLLGTLPIPIRVYTMEIYYRYKQMTEEVYAPVPRRTKARKSTPVTEWSVRITPVNQQPITAEEFKESGLDECESLIVCEEGEPNGQPRLHYHLYIKSHLSRTTLERMCAKLGRANNLVKGNAVFSIKQSNDGTIGYVIKNNNIITSVGYTQTTLDSYFKQSQLYKTKLETERRIQNKKKDQVFRKIFDDITDFAGYDDIIEQVTCECTKRGINFPSRMTMESNVLRMMYTRNPRFVNAFYSKIFEPRL